MIGLIFKVFAFFGILIAAALIALNITNVWNPGTISLTTPDVEPCRRWLEANHRGRTTELVQVRWIWTTQNYGWGCYVEFSDFDVITVTPMPE